MQSGAFGPRVRIILALGSSYLKDGMILASARMILAPCKCFARDNLPTRDNFILIKIPSRSIICDQENID